MGNLKPKSYEESAESEIDEDTNKVGNIFFTFTSKCNFCWTIRRYLEFSK